MNSFKQKVEKAIANIALTYGTKNENSAKEVGGGGNPHTKKSKRKPIMATRGKTN